VTSCRQASEHQPSEVGSFSYSFGKPWFHTEGRLAAVLIIPSSWGSQLGSQLYAIKQFFRRRCQGERGFLQGESLASNLLLSYFFALFYFCLHLFIKNTKNLVHLVIFACLLFSLARMSSPKVEVHTFKQQGGESLKDAWYPEVHFQRKLISVGEVLQLNALRTPQRPHLEMW
jgi:hypothetical protein